MKKFWICKYCDHIFIEHKCSCDIKDYMAISCTDKEYNKIRKREQHENKIKELRKEVSERLKKREGEMSNEL